MSELSIRRYAQIVLQIIGNSFKNKSFETFRDKDSDIIKILTHRMMTRNKNDTIDEDGAVT